MSFRVLFVIILVLWATYLTYTAFASATEVPLLPDPIRAQALALLVVATLGLLLERAVRGLRAAASSRYRDGYADGYVDGVTDRRPAPERTLRSVR